MLFLLLIVPALSKAQSHESNRAFQKSRPDFLGAALTALDNRSFTRLYAIRELGLQRKYLYTVSTETEYRIVFGYYPVDSLPVFDFSKQELIVYAACGQCLAFCGHQGKKNEACHRNACHFQQAWYLREKKQVLIAGN